MRKTLVVFDLAGQACAFPLEEVRQIIPLPALAHPPGLPEAIEGILDLGGSAVPVVRMDRLFSLPPQEIGLYTPLLLLGAASNPVAIPVDQVREILSLREESCSFLGDGRSLNGAAVGEIAAGGSSIHLLSAEHIFSAEERRRLTEFQTMAEQRLRMLESHT